MKLSKLNLSILNEYKILINEFKPNEKISFDILNKFFLNLPNNQIILLLEDNNKILGTGTIILEQKLFNQQKYVGHIEDVIIKKEYQGKGYGKILLEKIIDYCKKLNCYKVILNCDKNLEGFYSKCGFINKNIEMSLYFIPH